MFFSIRNHHNCLSQLFPIHLNTYVMGTRPLEIVYSDNVEIDFSRQNLTTKVDPRAVRVDNWVNVSCLLGIGLGVTTQPTYIIINH